MTLWEFLVVCGIGFIILELFVPSMFFLNFALAAFITAAVSVFVSETMPLVLIFFVFSLLSFIFLRPLLLKKKNKEIETGVNDKYIGKKARVTEEVTSEKGAISIYDERWNARSEDGSVIPAGSEVEIVKNDSLILYVKSLNN